MSVSLWNKIKKNVEYDVVIIGGGISGLSAAYWLSKYSDLRIAIVEKNTIGSGASGRNAGFITCGSVEHFSRLVSLHGLEESLKIWKFSEDNLSLLKEHIIKDKDIGFEHCGSFSLATEKTELDELISSANIMKDNNIDVEILNEIDVKSRLGVEKFIGGIKYLNDATVNPIKLLNEIKNNLGKNVDIFENNEVYEVNNSLVKTNQLDIKTSSTIYALNGYTSFIDKFFENKIYPTRGQVVSTEKATPFMEGACYANSFLDYFRQSKEGEFVIGGFRQENEEVTLNHDGINPKVNKELENFIKDYIPKLKDVKINHRWSGIMGFSTDGQPMVGSLPSNQEIFYLGGYTGHGLGLAFHCAKVLVDLMMEGTQLPVFLSGRRFEK
jgi:gamma-glutamylputrescine oxidase